MNDEPIPSGLTTPRRVLALGDSHTPGDWREHDRRRGREDSPARSQPALRRGAAGYMCGHRRLQPAPVRARGSSAQGPHLKPHYVVGRLRVRLQRSHRDLLPHSHGGVGVFHRLPRAYFDFDESGQLVRETLGTVAHTWRALTSRHCALHRSRRRSSVRALLGNFATFHVTSETQQPRPRDQGLGVRLGGAGLWPNMEVVLEKGSQPAERVQLAPGKSALLERIEVETAKLGGAVGGARHPVLALLPQVYDETWHEDRRGQSKYAREGGAPTGCGNGSSRGQIPYVDSMDALRAHVKKTGQWVHHRKDAHPTAEGT